MVDGHRPLNLNNIQQQDEDVPFEVWNHLFLVASTTIQFCSTTSLSTCMNCACVCDQLYIIDSGDPEDEASRPDLSVLEDMSENSDDSSGSSSDSDDLDSESEDEERRRKRRTVGEDGEPQDVDDEVQQNELSRRRRRRKQKRKQKELEQHIKDYYSVTYYGATASSYAFALASQLNKKTNTALWLNIVALTYYYVLELYTDDQYQVKAVLLQNEVSRLNGQHDDATPRRSITITSSLEFRFVLLRFWTLYDSMLHSNYVACRLGLWSEPGRLKLDTLLAKIGIPLAACKQRYSHLGLEYKRQLRDRMPQFADDYGLTNVLFLSFVKRVGFRSELSASDVVHSVNALLVSDDPQRFWTAYHSLGCGMPSDGIDLAINMMEAVWLQAKIVIDKQLVGNCGEEFLWITIRETVAPTTFSQPLALGQLAVAIRGALRMVRHSCPCVFACLSWFVAFLLPKNACLAVTMAVRLRRRRSTQRSSLWCLLQDQEQRTCSSLLGRLVASRLACCTGMHTLVVIEPHGSIMIWLSCYALSLLRAANLAVCFARLQTRLHHVSSMMVSI